jgi:hypothetical protein
MSGERQAVEASALDEGSWVYLSHLAGADGAERELQDRVMEACEASGWLAVSWSSPGRLPDPGRFFEGVRHAVEYADVVVAFIGRSTGMADAELAMAYSHGRPIVGVCLSDDGASHIQEMLRSYERARVINCANTEECVAGLRATFADPEFAETIRLAAGEQASHA